jgi:hypothetical protein
MAQNKLETQLMMADKLIKNIMEETKATLQLSSKEELHERALEKQQRKTSQSGSKNRNITRFTERNPRRIKKSPL